MGGPSARRTLSQPARGTRTRSRARAGREPLTLPLRSPQSFVSLARDVRSFIGQEHRYAHTVRVARLADRLAQRHGEDAGRARMAGMLHDLARLYSEQEAIAEAERRGLTIDAFERSNPIVLHARLGAEIARERFGIVDEGILSAIRRHTLAAPEMSRLDTILYLADGLEPGRAFAQREALEALAFADLEGALPALLRSTLHYLRGRHLDVAPQTLAALRASESQRSPLSA